MARETKNEDRKQKIRDAFQEGQAVERMPARYIVISEDITGVRVFAKLQLIQFKEDVDVSRTRTSTQKRFEVGLAGELQA